MKRARTTAPPAANEPGQSGQPRRPPGSSPRRPSYAAPAVDKALDILECLAGATAPLKQATIARLLGRRPEELYRMLARLEARGYLRRDPLSGAYTLSPRLREISRST